MKLLVLFPCLALTRTTAFAKDLNWTELARRPELWPAHRTVKVAMKFEGGQNVQVGQKVDVLEFKGNGILPTPSKRPAITQLRAGSGTFISVFPGPSDHFNPSTQDVLLKPRNSSAAASFIMVRESRSRPRAPATSATSPVSQDRGDIVGQAAQEAP